MSLSPSRVTTRQATIEDLNALVPLFDSYRVFYKKASDPEGARRFLHERFSHRESVIFLALVDGAAAGFTQLYPSFSSASMARIFVFNDLYVAPEARRNGAGQALLEAAAEYGRRTGAVRLALSTELTNRAAQALYEKNGWKRDEVFCGYQLEL
jgi:GNAT superfamily N-acetyltransferase